MRREEAKATWTEQQLLYINQLHLFTVMTLTGKVQIVEKDGDKQVVVKERSRRQDRKLHRHRAPEDQGADHRPISTRAGRPGAPRGRAGQGRTPRRNSRALPAARIAQAASSALTPPGFPL